MAGNSFQEDIRHLAKDAKPVHATGGFKEPINVQRALVAAADAIEELDARLKALEDQTRR